MLDPILSISWPLCQAASVFLENFPWSSVVFPSWKPLLWWWYLTYKRLFVQDCSVFFFCSLMSLCSGGDLYGKYANTHAHNTLRVKRGMVCKALWWGDCECGEVVGSSSSWALEGSLERTECNLALKSEVYLQILKGIKFESLGGLLACEHILLHSYVGHWLS